jgi:hypothetical protein
MGYLLFLDTKRSDPMATVNSWSLGRRVGGFMVECHGRDPTGEASAAFPAMKAHRKGTRT